MLVNADRRHATVHVIERKPFKKLINYIGFREIILWQKWILKIRIAKFLQAFV